MVIQIRVVEDGNLGKEMALKKKKSRRIRPKKKGKINKKLKIRTFKQTGENQHIKEAGSEVKQRQIQNERGKSMKDKIQGKIPREIARNINYLTSNLTKELTTINSTNDDDDDDKL